MRWVDWQPLEPVLRRCVRQAERVRDGVVEQVWVIARPVTTYLVSTRASRLRPKPAVAPCHCVRSNDPLYVLVSAGGVATAERRLQAKKIEATTKGVREVRGSWPVGCVIPRPRRTCAALQINGLWLDASFLVQ
jgi:hypothetical protein